MFRVMMKDMEEWCSAPKPQALLITGARQTGKTYIVREFAKKYFPSLVEINFLENKDAVGLVKNAKDAKSLISRISLLTEAEMIPGKTLIFFDEVQECPEIVTAIKFLVDEGSYRYILSGSLLGVELKDIKSVPVGYMQVLTMYPMDFYEFLLALHVSETVIDSLREAFEKKTPVDEFIHEKILDLYHLYLMIGGMPAVVETYLETNNLRTTVNVQNGIIALYKKDIAKYDPGHKLYLEEIFDLIPSEINSKNKRFILKNLNEHFKFSRYENSFLWLKDAGAALPVYCCDEPQSPLILSKATNLFKLFLSDVGLLAAMYAGDTQIKILNHELDLNFGSIYENAVAQELTAHGFSPYYYNNRKNGEVDFLIEDGGEVYPIEVKSGKNYTRHAALSHLLEIPTYHFAAPYVLAETNLRVENGVVYCPIYMTMFMKKKKVAEDQIYRPDLTGLV